jgi:hypothetical protein
LQNKGLNEWKWYSAETYREFEPVHDTAARARDDDQRPLVAVRAAVAAPLNDVHAAARAELVVEVVAPRVLHNVARRRQFNHVQVRVQRAPGQGVGDRVCVFA